MGNRGKREFIQVLRLMEAIPARLNLAAYPHLPKTSVKTTSAADYAVLTPGRAA